MSDGANDPAAGEVYIDVPTLLHHVHERQPIEVAGVRYLPAERVDEQGEREIRAALLTTENRGDHAADVRIELPVIGGTTLRELVNLATQLGGQYQYATQQRVLLDSDAIEVRVVARPPVAPSADPWSSDLPPL